MRVSSTVERLDVSPGSSGVVPLEVINTSEVIESLSVRAIGLPEALVRSEPRALALFPEASGALTLTLDLPDAFPAGTYPLTFVIAGSAPGAAEAFHDLDLVVPPQPRLALTATPSLVRTRGRAAFTVEVRNEGNVPLDVALRAVDTDRTLRTSLTPSTLTVPAGAVATTTVLVRGPRQLLGSDRDRPLRVVAQATETTADVELVLRQKSTFSRGLLTALVLLSILAAWALAFVLGMREVLGADPYAKVAPPSFFVNTATAEGTLPEGMPAGAMPKEGPVPAGTGATLTGLVLGETDQQGVGRVTVTAWRQGRDAPVEVSSAATQADGSYSLAGLFPGPYLLEVAAEGYETVWYEAGTSFATGTQVDALAQQVTTGVDLAVTGDPASISGNVETGEAPGEVVVQVTAKPAWAGADPATEYVTATDAAGAYTFADLPAPGTYELSFVAEGYQPSSLSERVLGGQSRFALDVTLGAGPGQISGTVTDGSAPVGGVEVSTTMDGKPVVVGTPTIGQVGQFVVPNLKTPGTYVLTFTKAGFSTQTVVVDLGPGEQRADLRVLLAGGAGTVTGSVVDAFGIGIGGVTVTAGGSANTVTTTTLTAGSVGSFTLTGLATGSVTLTFSKAGYTPASVPVTLTDAGPPAPVTVALSSALGNVTGRVTQNGAGVPGATVQATDGTITRSTTSTASGGFGAGTYLLPDLPAGTYTVSVNTGGAVLATAVVTVRPGATTSQDLPIAGSP